MDDEPDAPLGALMDVPQGARTDTDAPMDAPTAVDAPTDAQVDAQIVAPTDGPQPPADDGNVIMDSIEEFI